MASKCPFSSGTSSDEKATGVLFFDRKGLLYEIAQIAYVAHDVRKEVEDEHSRHQTADILQDGNRDLIARQLDLAHTTAVDLLNKLTKTAVTDGESRDDYLEPGDYRIILHVPEDFPKNALTHLKNLVHDYLIASALAYWLALVLDERAQYWQARTAALEESIKKMANRLGKARRRTLCPF